MTRDSHEWVEDILQDLFVERDKRLIRGIHLSSFENEDHWYWDPEASSIHSIWSAYRLLQSIHVRYNADDNSGFWRTLWNLKLPPKVFGVTFMYTEHQDLRSCFKQLFSRGVGNTLLIIGMICWMLWRARNDLVWNGNCWTENEVVIAAVTYFDKWKKESSS
ncbi:uncharacterized protein LOC133791338 [Humulus lupulus]|uniref:uncharacterized protein LOC133791338 n=1 Tax=Humulus lupulus TaxID=3486 RepID=UPI002B414CF9|nr:uncharacterized protein LOC133791338 [Humulus lupulus]